MIFKKIFDLTTYDNDPDEKDKVEDEKDEYWNLLKRFFEFQVIKDKTNLVKKRYQYNVRFSVLHQRTALYGGLVCLVLLIDELRHHPDNFVKRGQSCTDNYL